MRIHHLNCGTMCPVGGWLIHGRSRDATTARLVCHCLLIETPDDGLVLVDTGLGMQDVLRPARLSPFFRNLMRLPLRAEETAMRQIEALGFKARDVRHIVVTHLDFDHAGGIEDFPGAAVHVLEPEHRAATAGRSGWVGRQRYRPSQWDAVERWELYPSEGEPWFAFQGVRDLRGLPPEILFVPLIGHTWGHSGVAVALPSGWLFLAGDAYFHADEMLPARPSCPIGLRAYQRLMEVDRAARLANQQRLRDLVRAHAREITIFSSHDPHEFARSANPEGPLDLAPRRPS